jgi:putative transposase
MILSHRIRLDPNKSQETYFRRACGVARFTYNWAVKEWKTKYEVGEKPSGLNLKKEFNSIRKEQFPWTYEVHRDCTSQAFSYVQKAFTSFFKKKSKYPKFHKKGQKDSFYLANDVFSLSGKEVKLPFIGKVKMRESLRFQGKIMSGTVKRVADKWFLNVQVDMGDDYKRGRSAHGQIGIDVGLKHFATFSDGTKVQAPKPLKANLEKLRRLSRQHSRKKKGSNNRFKSSVKLARLHNKVSNVRNDFLHKLSNQVCRENQTVVIEDLNVAGMVKNRSLSRAISDVGWSEFRRQLTYKSVLYGSQLILVDRFFPSSKKCFYCDNVKEKLGLNEREYVCYECGVCTDRDVNAANNILKFGKIGWATPELTLEDKRALAHGNMSETSLVESRTLRSVQQRTFQE